MRFDNAVINKLIQLKIYSWSEEKFIALKNYICGNDINALEKANSEYSGSRSSY
jgi:chloramphenicol O-acetyltransferase type B